MRTFLDSGKVIPFRHAGTGSPLSQWSCACAAVREGANEAHAQHDFDGVRGARRTIRSILALAAAPRPVGDPRWGSATRSGPVGDLAR